MSSTNNKQEGRKQSFFNARLTSTISIALVLYVLGGVTLMGLLAAELSSYVKENIGFSIVLSDKASDKQIGQLQRELDNAVYVKSYDYISKEAALQELIAQLGEDPEEFLGYNPLLASMEVCLKSEYANNDSLQWIESKMRAHSYVTELNYQKDLIQLVNDNIKRIGVALLALAFVFMFISFALISNTIRLMAYSKRFLIHTMKLVGATPAFICRPFIGANIGIGIVAALLAIAMLGGSLYYMSTQIENIYTLVNIESLLIVAGVVIVLSVIITSISAFLAVNRYIRMDRDDLYYV